MAISAAALAVVLGVCAAGLRSWKALEPSARAFRIALGVYLLGWYGLHVAYYGYLERYALAPLPVLAGFFAAGIGSLRLTRLKSVLAAALLAGLCANRYRVILSGNSDEAPAALRRSPRAPGLGYAGTPRPGRYCSTPITGPSASGPGAAALGG